MSEKEIRLVLDTNTIISAFLWRGNEFKLLSKIEQGKASLYLTSEILKEIDTVLHYPKLEKYIAVSGLTVEEILEKIFALAHIVLGENTGLTISRDSSDDKFIECALNAKANYIVSGDKDLLVIGCYKDIKIVSTKQILDLLP